MCSFLVRVLVIIALLLTGCGGGSSTDDPTNKNPPIASPTDTDGDNIPDNEDEDDDNDGLADEVDPNPTAMLKMGRIQAEFFTENPESIIGPVKVLFAIDCSFTMIETDPAGRRFTAVREFIDRFNTEDYPTISFGIVLWSAAILDQTQDGDGKPVFTRSPEELNRVLDNARNETSTDYLGAISAVNTMVADDMQDSESRLSRTHYIVCFLSDGPPNTDGSMQPEDEIVNSVEAIKNTAEQYGVGRFNFHTYFLSAIYRNDSGDYLTDHESQTGRMAAEKILRDIAKVGNGNYLDFSDADAITFADFGNLRPVSQYQIKFVVAYNHMVRPHMAKDTLVMDSDGDGLADIQELEIGTDPGDRDTDDDGLSDGFEISIQAKVEGSGDPIPNPLSADSNCSPPTDGIWSDQDGDGLTDCEESVKKTLSIWVDSDDDYLPDGIEVDAGTDPMQNLYSQDTDMDAVQDVFEVRNHTNALADDPILRERFAYSYSLTDHGALDPHIYPDSPQGIRRYIFDISNVGLLDTKGAVADDIFNSTEGLRPGDNVIRIYVAQVPKDRPNDPAVFRMAQAIINFNDESQDIVLTRDDFMLLP